MTLGAPTWEPAAADAGRTGPTRSGYAGFASRTAVAQGTRVSHSGVWNFSSTSWRVFAHSSGVTRPGLPP